MVDAIQAWWIQIGTFSQPRKCRKDVDKLFLSRKSLFLAVRICLMLLLIILMWLRGIEP